MANKYWVGGSGGWADTTHWSDTSGGAGGASVPAATDVAVFDANSGTGQFVVTASASFTVGGIDATACPYANCSMSVAIARGTATATIKGNVLLPANFALKLDTGFNLTVDAPTGATVTFTAPTLSVREGRTLTLGTGGAGGAIVLGAPVVPISGGSVSIGGTSLDMNGYDINNGEVGDVSHTAGALINNGRTIKGRNVTLSSGYVGTLDTVEAAIGIFSTAPMIYNCLMTYVGQTQIGAGSTFCFLTRWVQKQVDSFTPTLTVNNTSSNAPVTVTKKLTIASSPAAPITVDCTNAATPAVFDAPLCSLNDCNIGNVQLTGASVPAIVNGGGQIAGTASQGFLFPPAAILPLFSTGLLA